MIKKQDQINNDPVKSDSIFLIDKMKKMMKNYSSKYNHNKITNVLNQKMIKMNQKKMNKLKKLQLQLKTWRKT